MARDFLERVVATVTNASQNKVIMIGTAGVNISYTDVGVGRLCSRNLISGMLPPDLVQALLIHVVGFRFGFCERVS